MKIVIISNLFPPYVRGGAERVAAATAKAFRELGHEVVVVTGGPALPGPKRFALERSEWAGLTVLRFFPQNFYFTLDDYKYPKSVRVFWHARDAFNLFSAGMVRKILKQERPDLVITHNLKGLGLLIPGVIQKLGLRHVHVLHDVQLVEPSGLLMALGKASRLISLQRAISTSVTSRLMGSPALVVSPTEWLLEFHRARGFFPKSKFVVIPNPSIAEGLPNPKPVSPSELRPATVIPSEQLRAERSRIRFVFLGQLEPHKGVAVLLEAFQAALDQGLDAELDIVGGGTQLDSLRARFGSSEHIRFHGAVPHDKALKVLSGATALVSPSLCLENSPGAILDAFSMSVPVIASEVGGVPEIVKENQTGWLVPAGAVEELSRMLRHVVTHPKEIQMIKTALLSRTPMNPQEYAERLIKEAF